MMRLSVLWMGALIKRPPALLVQPVMAHAAVSCAYFCSDSGHQYAWVDAIATPSSRDDTPSTAGPGPSSLRLKHVQQTSSGILGELIGQGTGHTLIGVSRHCTLTARFPSQHWPAQSIRHRGKCTKSSASSASRVAEHQSPEPTSNPAHQAPQPQGVLEKVEGDVETNRSAFDHTLPGSSKRMHAAAPTSDQLPSSATPLSQDYIYFGPLSYTHKMLKRVSIANTAIALAAAPAIVAFADISYISRVGLAGAMVFFGLLTTGALHWITNPYVHELRYTAATQMLDVRTASLLGFVRWDKFSLSDVRPMSWERPVATFMAKGRPYYIDVYSFEDPELLKHLTPDENSVPKGFKDDDDDD